MKNKKFVCYEKGGNRDILSKSKLIGKTRMKTKRAVRSLRKGDPLPRNRYGRSLKNKVYCANPNWTIFRIKQAK